MKKSIIILGTIFAILLVSGFHCFALDTINGYYQKKEGQLRIVPKDTACRPSETPLSWNIVGPQGPAGPAGPPGPQAPQVNAQKIPLVYDANEQLLGILPSNSDGFLSVFIPALSRFIFLSPDDGDVHSFYPSVYLYFEDNKCLGKPYLDTSMRYLVFKLGSNYYKADDVAAQPKTINSLSYPMWDGGRQCQTRSSTDTPVLPFTQVELPFTMPVALPLHFE
jgi:hypothetical protein